MKIANRIIEKEPQINADERRYKPVTDFIGFFNGMLFSVMDFGATHRKGRKEREEKRQESLLPLLHSMKKHRLSELRTRMTRIRRIFTDTANPCASVSSVQSVFYRSCSRAALLGVKASAPISVPLLMLSGEGKGSEVR